MTVHRDSIVASTSIEQNAHFLLFMGVCLSFTCIYKYYGVLEYVLHQINASILKINPDTSSKSVSSDEMVLNEPD